MYLLSLISTPASRRAGSPLAYRRNFLCRKAIAPFHWQIINKRLLREGSLDPRPREPQSRRRLIPFPGKFIKFGSQYYFVSPLPLEREDKVVD